MIGDLALIVAAYVLVRYLRWGTEDHRTRPAMLIPYILATLLTLVAVADIVSISAELAEW